LLKFLEMKTIIDITCR